MDGDGTFNAEGLENLLMEVGLAKRGFSYTIVSIIGPQSSGKSTLLNHLFGTTFKEMDAFEGRSKTTRGIWMAECADIDPCTLVMDLEGCDGKERAEDKAFEKWIALFALAVSDIVLINMWCNDIGRDEAANRPLLKIVFQVMTKLFTPNKTTLMFVIRDKTKTPLEKLEPLLRDDIQEIWNSVPKAEGRERSLLSEFFNVEVVALSNFESAEKEFKEQVANLREQFCEAKSPNGLARDSQRLVPGDAFSFSIQEMWKVIMANEDLNLPSLKILVANLRCQEIAKEIFDSFVENKLNEAAKTQAEYGDGERRTLIFQTCLSEYDMKTEYFDGHFRNAKRKELEEKLQQETSILTKVIMANKRGRRSRLAWIGVKFVARLAFPLVGHLAGHHLVGHHVCHLVDAVTDIHT